MALNYPKFLCLVAFVFFIGAFGLNANAGIYNYNYYVCCSGYYADYYPVGVYNAQGDPAYYAYDQYVDGYAYVDPYPTGSIPSYPYSYTYRPIYVPAYAYVGCTTYGYAGCPGYIYSDNVYVARGYAYSPYVYSEYTQPYSYPAYEVRFA